MKSQQQQWQRRRRQRQQQQQTCTNKSLLWNIWKPEKPPLHIFIWPEAISKYRIEVHLILKLFPGKSKGRRIRGGTHYLVVQNEERESVWSGSKLTSALSHGNNIAIIDIELLLLLPLFFSLAEFDGENPSRSKLSKYDEECWYDSAQNRNNIDAT